MIESMMTLKRFSAINAVAVALQWLRRLFHRHEINPSSPRCAEPPARRKAARPRRDIKGGIGYTLDRLEATFSRVKQADMGSSWTDKYTRSGLRKLGPYVVPRGTEVPNVIDPATARYPSLMFVSLAYADDDQDELNINHVPARFLYAVKLKKLPWMCSRPKADIYYEVGIAFSLNNKKLWWGMHYVGVNTKTGRITCSRYLDYQPCQLPQGTYYRKTWSYSPLHEKGADYLAEQMAFALNFWNTRHDYWQVSAKTDGSRVTFCIPQNEAKDYFKDRGRKALTAAGRLRPIIHYVQSHDRQLTDGRSTTVKEHIRGLRKFSWNGYECAVTAPRFHAWTSDSFDVPGVPEEHVEDDVGTLDLDQVAGMLADMEDDQRRPAKGNTP